MKLFIRIIFFIFILIFISSMVLSQENKVLDVEKDASECLKSSQDIFDKMIENNFSVERVNDTLENAKNFYNSQILLKNKRSSYDFSLVISYCNDISLIYKNALISIDELAALEKFYSEFDKDFNYSEVEDLISLIKEDIDGERYEDVPGLVDDTYQKLIDIRASQTTLNLFYASTTSGIKKFFFKYWEYITFFFSFLFFSFLFLRRPIFRYILNSKLRKVVLKKKTIKKLIMNTQKGYFQDNKLSESTYNIRTKRLVEMVRDIDRQIPILNERLAKLSRVAKKFK